MAMIWTDERVETLRKLWTDGLSASQIAQHFDGVSRNAIIGKLHRLGGPSRPQPVVQARPTRKPAAEPTTAAPVEPPVEEAVFETLPASAEERGLATTTTLQAYMCKWPIGDPAQTDFTFCGRTADGGRPYCSKHAHTAYRPGFSAGRQGLSPELSRLVARYA